MIFLSISGSQKHGLLNNLLEGIEQRRKNY